VSTWFEKEKRGEREEGGERRGGREKREEREEGGERVRGREGRVGTSR
jgi:hypothetical protein